MRPKPHAAGLYLAVLQFVFTLGWTVYAIYLPKLAAAVGITAGAVIFILMLDQADLHGHRLRHGRRRRQGFASGGPARPLGRGDHARELRWRSSPCPSSPEPASAPRRFWL